MFITFHLIDRGFFVSFIFFFFLQPLLSVLEIQSSCRTETETNLSTWKKQSWDSSGRLLYKRDRGFNFVSEVRVVTKWNFFWKMTRIFLRKWDARSLVICFYSLFWTWPYTPLNVNYIPNSLPTLLRNTSTARIALGNPIHGHCGFLMKGKYQAFLVESFCLFFFILFVIDFHFKHLFIS